MYIENQGANLAALGPGSRLLTEGFRTLFFMELEESDPVFSKIFEIRESLKREEFDFEFVGQSMAQLAEIGGPTEFESPLDGGTKRVPMLLYKKGFQVAEEDEDDDLYNVLGKVGAQLPKTFVRRSESLAAGVFAGQFTSTTGFDGLPICSTAHTYPTGRSNMRTGATTWSNRLAFDAALSPESLQSLQILLRQTTDREGAPADLKGDTLVVPVELEARAHEILKSMYRAYTDTNEVNVFANGGLWPMKVISWPWLPSTTMYSVMDSSKTPFYWYWRQRPTFRNQTEMNAGIKQYYGKQRCAADASEPRGITSTPGA